MPALAEDFTVFGGEFAVDGVLDGRAVRVILDNGYRSQLGVGAREPQASLATTDAGAATRGSVLVVAGTTYRVRAVQPDGTGWTDLVLEQ